MTEARVWQLVGILGALVAAVVLRGAIVEFEAVATSPSATYADGLWAYGRGVLAGFLFVGAAATLVTAHVLRVIGGVRHRRAVWLRSAVAAGLAGVGLVVFEGTNVAEQIAASQIPEFWMTDGFPSVIAGCFLLLVAVLLLSGERMASHVIKSRSLRPPTTGS
jgi:hypothetical protein